MKSGYHTDEDAFDEHTADFTIGLLFDILGRGRKVGAGNTTSGGLVTGNGGFVDGSAGYVEDDIVQGSVGHAD